MKGHEVDAVLGNPPPHLQLHEAVLAHATWFSRRWLIAYNNGEALLKQGTHSSLLTKQCITLKVPELYASKPHCAPACQSVSQVSQGFYSRWGQLGHLAKLRVVASDIVTDRNTDRERRRQIQSS